MRILINTSLLRFGGPVQVALSIINECRLYSQHEFHVVLGPGPGTVLEQSEFPNNFRFYFKSFGVMNWLKTRRVHQEMADLEADIVPDCVITTTGPAYWRSRAPHLMGFNLGLYIYPESPYFDALSNTARLRFYAKRFIHRKHFQKEADALFVQTDDVNQRVRKFLRNDNIYTITNNHNGWYQRPPEVPMRLPLPKQGTFRLLTLTSFYRHKNLDLIHQVIEALPEDLRTRLEFVLTLTEAEYRRKISKIIPRQVRLVGPVPPPECPALYRECDAMFLPTLVECFSASYPEAMKMERPIITTDLGFARSICQDAALYFEPGNAQSAAKKVEELINDTQLQERLRHNGKKRLAAFDSPAERAKKILKICQDLAGGTERIAATNRRT